MCQVAGSHLILDLLLVRHTTQYEVTDWRDIPMSNLEFHSVSNPLSPISDTGGCDERLCGQLEQEQLITVHILD